MISEDQFDEEVAILKITKKKSKLSWPFPQTPWNLPVFGHLLKAEEDL